MAAVRSSRALSRGMRTLGARRGSAIAAFCRRCRRCCRGEWPIPRGTLSPPTGQLADASTGSSPVDRARKGLQAPPDLRRARSDPDALAHRRQPERRHPAAAPDRRDRPDRVEPGRPRPAPPNCSPTAATTTTRTAASNGAAASNRSSPVARSSTAPGWAGRAGWSSGPSPGCTGSTACGATSAATNATSPFLTLGCAANCQRLLA
jgi:hypothetical protein